MTLEKPDDISTSYVSNEEPISVTGKKDVAKFLDTILVLCRGFGFSLSHEDTEGAFVVEEYSEVNAQWLRDAIDRTT